MSFMTKANHFWGIYIGVGRIKRCENGTLCFALSTGLLRQAPSKRRPSKQPTWWGGRRIGSSSGRGIRGSTSSAAKFRMRGWARGGAISTGSTSGSVMVEYGCRRDPTPAHHRKSRAPDQAFGTVHDVGQPRSLDQLPFCSAALHESFRTPGIPGPSE